MAAAPRGLDSPPAFPDEIAEEVLLRLPPDEPAWLFRASLVCKPWRRLISRRNFLRCLYEHHRAPPVLGFFFNEPINFTARFAPTTASAFSVSVPVPDDRDWLVFDCRHGRVLLCSDHTMDAGQDLLVWDPITGHQQLVPVPPVLTSRLVNGIVLCAADRCGHRDCHGGPFRLAVIFRIEDSSGCNSVTEYSSMTNTWGDVLNPVFYDFLCRTPSPLVGNSLLYFLSAPGYILEYDLDGRRAPAKINLPDQSKIFGGSILLMPAEDGGLGVAVASDGCLHLWSRKVSDSSDAGWVLSRVIKLDKMFPAAAFSSLLEADVIGFAEEPNVIFVLTSDGIFAIELKSERARKVYRALTYHRIGTFLPFISFYIPGKQVAAQEEGDRTP